MASKLPKLKLWYYPMYRSTRCVWLIKELGIEDVVEYKYVPMTSPPGPERLQYAKTVHPHSTVPALEIEGRPPILESAAICLYLADLCGRLAPETKDRAEYYHWILYSSSRLDECMEDLNWWCDPELDPRVTAKAKAATDLCLDIIEQRLSDRDYILGTELTAADCVLGYNIIWASLPEMKNGLLLEGRPNLKAYLERIKARPALQEALNIGKTGETVKC